MTAERHSVDCVTWCLVCCVTAAWLMPHAVRAQSNAPSVGVLRATGPSAPAKLVDDLDQALLRELALVAGVDHPTISPADYEALQLAVGCEGESPECLSSIAQTVQTDAVLVRRLNVDANGLTTLDLFYFASGGQRDVSSAHASEPAASRARLTAAMPRLVAKLFGIEDAPAPVPVGNPKGALPRDAQVAPSVPPESTSDEPREATHEPEARVGTWTWLTLISGTALLGTGAVIGVTANASFDTLKQTTPRTPEDTQRLHRDFESIEARSSLANILMPAGGALLAVGATLLVFDLSADDGVTSDASGTVALKPVRGGAVVTLSGTLGGF